MVSRYLASATNRLQRIRSSASRHLLHILMDLVPPSCLFSFFTVPTFRQTNDYYSGCFLMILILLVVSVVYLCTLLVVCTNFSFFMYSIMFPLVFNLRCLGPGGLLFKAGCGEGECTFSCFFRTGSLTEFLFPMFFSCSILSSLICLIWRTFLIGVILLVWFVLLFWLIDSLIVSGVFDTLFGL